MGWPNNGAMLILILWFGCALRLITATMHGGCSGLIMEAHHTWGRLHIIMAKEVLAFMVWGGWNAWRRNSWQFKGLEANFGAVDFEVARRVWLVFGERCVDQRWRGTIRKREKERAWKNRDQQRRSRRFLENAEELRRLLVADFFRCVSN